jgi:putative colanic acid biosynthesis acetyltransferase WcaF
MGLYYSTREIILRVIWGFVEPVFFRFSPRFFYGWRNIILKMMGAKIGYDVRIYPTARITYPWLLEVGDRSVISWDVRIYNLGKIRIGSNTVISQHSHLCGGTHDYLSENFELIRSGLTVGSNVWLSTDVFIGPGVNVSDGVVVAACSVVIHDVPALSVVAGNPARIVKKLEKAPVMHYGRKKHQ